MGLSAERSTSYSPQPEYVTKELLSEPWQEKITELIKDMKKTDMFHQCQYFNLTESVGKGNILLASFFFCVWEIRHITL